MKTNLKASGDFMFIQRSRRPRGSAVNRSCSFLKFCACISLAVVGLISAEGRSYGAGKVVSWGYSSNAPAGLTGVTAIAAGGTDYYYYPYLSLPCLALTGDGSVMAWSGDSYETNVPPDSTNVVAIATSGWTSLALREDGRVVAWGVNCCGQEDVPAQLTNVIAIAAGEYHNLALQADGRIVGWGDNSYGETTAPADLTNAVAIACGTFCSFALREDGTVDKWGYGGAITGLPGLTNVIAIAVTFSGDKVMALKADGTIAVWPSSVQFYALTNVVAISPGLALHARGTVDLITGSSFSVPQGLTNIIAVAGDSASCLALVGDGSPALLRPPVSRGRVFTGRPFTLQAVAAGDEPLSYQWFCNGAGIPGATNSTLTLPATGLGDAGVYRLAVSNALGSIVSRPTFLAVVDAPPSIKTLSADQLVQPGGNALLEVAPDGSGPLEYQWSFNGAEIPGATNNSLSITNATWQDAGTYSVAIANSLGSITSPPMRVFLSFEYPFDAASGPVLWDFDGVFSGPWNRTIRGSGTNVTVRVSYRETNVESRISFVEWIEVRRTHRMILKLNADATQLIGSDKVTETRYDIFSFLVTKVKNLGSSGYSLPVALPLPAGTDGSWKLNLQVIPSGARLSGAAQISFPGQTPLPFGLTGNYSAKTGVAKILLQGSGPAKGAMLRLTASGPGMSIQSMRGQIGGQSARFP